MYRKNTFFVPATIPIVAPVLLILTSDPAFAYIGPGAGLSAIGAALALVGAVALAIVGFLWYPAKRLARRLFNRPGPDSAQMPDARADTRTPGPPPR